MQSTKWQATWSLMFFVLCIEHQNMKSCNSTQNHAKHKMTSHKKFDHFVLCRTSKTWNLVILHKVMQSTKWQAPWSLMFFVLRIEHQNMKSCDSTQSHAKHKMTSTMKFDVFCSTHRTSKHEILRFYTKSCKAQNDKHHEVWCFLFYV